MGQVRGGRRHDPVARDALLVRMVIMVLSALVGRGAALAGFAAPALAVPLFLTLHQGVDTWEGPDVRWLGALAVVGGFALVAPLPAVAALGGAAVAVALGARALLRRAPSLLLPLVGLGCAVVALGGGAASAPLWAGGLALTAQVAAGMLGAEIVSRMAVDDDAGAAAVGRAALAGAVAAGVGQTPLGPFPVAAVAAAFLARQRGTAADGALAGTAVGVLAALALGHAWVAVAGAVAGAASGLVRSASSWSRAATCGAGMAAVACGIASPPSWAWAVGGLLGAVLGALRPSEVSGVSASAPAPATPEGPGGVAASRAERLRAAAASCLELSRRLAEVAAPPAAASADDVGMGHPGPGDPEPMVSQALRLAERVCPGCPSLEACWERRLPRARRMVTDVWRAALEGGLQWQQVGGTDTVFCLRPREMADAANQEARQSRQSRELHRLLAAGYRAGVIPLAGLGDVLLQLADEVAAASEDATPAAGNQPLRCVRWEGTAPGGTGYEVVATWAARTGQRVSGDCVRCRLLDDDRLAVVLSDGMGSGPEAAVAAAAAAERLLAALAAGDGVPTALAEVNGLLLDDPSVGRCATVDLLLLQLRTGTVEWHKMGGAPAFVVQARGVRDWPGGGLPAGVLGVPEVRSGRGRLRPDDAVLLVSDGLLERPAARVSVGRGGRWVGQWLRDRLGRGPQGAVDLAVQLVQAVAGITDHDDVTVVACRWLTGSGSGGGPLRTGALRRAGGA